MKPFLLNDWNDSDTQEILNDFRADKGYNEIVEILLASYTYENYSGSAYVLYRNLRNNELYEVCGSHCSCYGLEEQWEPELVTLEYLEDRLLKDYINREYKKEYSEVLTMLTGNSNG
jgi:hypothetical protein